LGRNRSWFHDGVTSQYNYKTERLTIRAPGGGGITVAIIGALGPVTTIAFGWLGLEEVMTPLQLANAALVLVGVVVISLRPAAPAKG
jgi:hypothetical protein